MNVSTSDARLVLTGVCAAVISEGLDAAGFRRALGADHPEAPLLVLRRLVRLESSSDIDRRTCLVTLVDACAGAASPTAIPDAVSELVGLAGPTSGPEQILVARGLGHVAASTRSPRAISRAEAGTAGLDKGHRRFWSRCWPSTSPATTTADTPATKKNSRSGSASSGLKPTLDVWISAELRQPWHQAIGLCV